MFSRKTLQTLSILLFNLLPVIGVSFYNWSPFDMFWLFWMESLVISFFNAIRVLFSQGKTREVNETGEHLHYNLANSVKYLIGRIFIFIFYSIFIIVFIGFVSNTEKDTKTVVQTLVFHNELFNIALLLAVVSNAFYLVKYFFFTRAYLYSKVDDYPMIFDGRQIVIHVAIVLGAVGSGFLFTGKQNARYGAVWIICILCITKCIFELYFMRREDRDIESGITT